MIAGESRQPVESEIVFFRRLRAVVRLQQRDDVLVEVEPPTFFRFVFLDVRLQRRRVFGALRRHRQISGQDVVERRNVGRSLNRRMTAQREDAAAGTSDVAEEKLQDRCGANDLHAGRMLRPADRIANRRSFIWT